MHEKDLSSVGFAPSVGRIFLLQVCFIPKKNQKLNQTLENFGTFCQSIFKCFCQFLRFLGKPIR